MNEEEILKVYSSLTKYKFKNLLEDLQENYTNGEPLVSDEFFDYLTDFYFTKFDEEFNLVGFAPEKAFIKEPLEYYMSSLDKAKGKLANKKLELFLKKNSKIGPTNSLITESFILEDKLDGCSAQITFTKKDIKILTRGDGQIGSNISALSKYLNLPSYSIFSLKENGGKIVVKGEIVISKDNFNLYSSEELKNENNKNNLLKSRTTLAGIVNSTSRGEEIDPKLGSLLDFVAYEILYPNTNETDQLSTLKKMGFKIPTFEYINSLNIEELENNLINRRKTSSFDIDGLVIIANNNKYYEIEKDKNPSHKIAFKLDTFATTKVIDVEWNISSKDGLIKPVVVVEEVMILGSHVNNPTGKNAKFIIDKKIGRGAVVIITLGGDIIPDIVFVEKPAKEKDMIYPDLDEDEYEWNKSGVEFVLTNIEDSEDVMMARFKYFLKHLDVKDIGKSNIKKIYENGIDTFYKLFEMTVNDIKDIGSDKKIGEKTATKICNGIKEAITNVELYKIMGACCIFGRGFSLKKTKLIVDTYPNILEMASLDEEEISTKIKNIKGFASLSSDQFASNLKKFNEWLIEHPQIKIKKSSLSSSLKKEEKKGEERKVVFSGFRKLDDEFHDNLSKYNFIVEDSITKNTNILITKNIGDNTSKVEKARKYNIEVIDIEGFKEKYF